MSCTRRLRIIHLPGTEPKPWVVQYDTSEWTWVDVAAFEHGDQAAAYMYEVLERDRKLLEADR